MLLIILAAFGACFEPLITKKRDYCLRDCSTMPGTCQEVNEEFICVCLDGYTGGHISGCQDIDECAEGKSNKTKEIPGFEINQLQVLMIVIRWQNVRTLKDIGSANAWSATKVKVTMGLVVMSTNV